jgi:hypothetical protein
VTDAWPKKRREKANALKAEAELARELFELLDEQGVDPFLGTRHAAENSYCLWCEPKGYSHWEDQEEHAPDCKFVAVMTKAREVFK